ncbi:alkene reductase [Desertifilum sp. FACHB-1129]|uniref:Alkene reductase n=1 Tax=Desertifilum tharense IPPAS B-1220 TaxID=1781255 RepID=A0A1E5QR94_9CYAN|nr:MULTISPECIES: alkene reductase [Desertifilum]MDA0209225.1 alkene reductase [Cyanobacteria bacterium FC1]MBD2311879.1 alkene reductase [Desertifilum sp. FACHB-1129]MBD2323023.1 alkene reductase [Desertifilum sp. FACHB-866]MBD2333454.1 alkene reductase [Desertifilum sp. FACHB-868]OEJ76863.1 alkene reductase [Desertifilum tharense IPPAS B-1220]
MNSSIPLLQPYKLGALELPNRIVMAPLTRNRALPGNIPGPLNAEYYAQRASAGLIISEATQVSPQGLGYPNTPGIYSPEQVEGWKLVTEAVHRHGGRIFLQLWHVGRISHPSLQPNGELPVAPSAIAPTGEASTFSGPQPFVTPRALELNEIPQIIEQYRKGAENALAAGFDGVEIHSANGYLLDQFLQDNANHRTDEYGGSVENRARLLLEVTEAVTKVWGSDRVGIRLSPSGEFNDMNDSNREATFSYVVKALNRFNLAYLHLVEPRVAGNETVEGDVSGFPSSFFRPLYNNTIISAGGHDRETGNATLEAGDAELIAYGRWFISNPDLPKRFELNAPLTPYDRDTFYGGTEKGYTDYPTLERETVSP